MYFFPESITKINKKDSSRSSSKGIRTAYSFSDTIRLYNIRSYSRNKYGLWVEGMSRTRIAIRCKSISITNTRIV